MSLSLLFTVMVSFATLCVSETTENVWRTRFLSLLFYLFWSAPHLSGDVLALFVPFEGWQWISMVGVAGQSQLVPLPIESESEK